MKIVRYIVLLTSFLVLFISLEAWSSEQSSDVTEGDRPTVSSDLGLFTKYIWRGFELSDDSFVIQPSITAGYKGFSVNLWGNWDLDLDDRDPTTEDKKKWNETDLTLSYDRSFGPVGLGVGYIYYALDGIDDSEELYVSAALDILLSPTLTIYREIAHTPSWYINFGISHSIELPQGMSLDLGGSLSYYHYDDDSIVEVDNLLNPTTKKYQNFHDGLLSAGLTIPFKKYFSVTPMIAYSFPLTDEADDFLTSSNSFSNDSDFFYGGISVSMAF